MLYVSDFEDKNGNSKLKRNKEFHDLSFTKKGLRSIPVAFFKFIGRLASFPAERKSSVKKIIKLYLDEYPEKRGSVYFEFEFVSPPM